MKNMIIAALFTFSQIAFAGPSGVDVKAGNQMSGMLFRENHSLNAGFEANNENNVTDSSGIATVTSTSPISGNYSLAIDATTSGELVKILGKTIKQVGTSCESVFYYTGDATLYKAYVLQGATKVSQELTLSNVGTNVQPVSLIFPCGAGTAPDVTIESTGNGAAIKVDDFYSGMPVNIGTVAQAKFLGSVKYAGVTGCTWSRTGAGSNSFGNFAADTDCNTPTVIGSGVQTPGTKIPAVVIPNAPAGEYLFIATGAFSKAGASDDNVIYRFSDGTNSSSGVGLYSGTGTPSTPVISGRIAYSTSQSNITVNIQGLTSNTGNSVNIVPSTSTVDLEISVYYFPSSAQTVVSTQQAEFAETDCPTITGSWVANTTYTCKWSRRKNRAYFDINVATSGTPTSATLTVNLPITIDTSKMTSLTSNFSILSNSRGSVIDGSTGVYPIDVLYVSTTSVSPVIMGTASTYGGATLVTQAVPIAFGSTDSVNLKFDVPVVGWIENPAPLIPQSVISPSSGVEKVARATVSITGATSATILRQSGNWASVNSVSGSSVTLNMSGAAFPTSPTCNITCNNASVNSVGIIGGVDIASNSITFACVNLSGAAISGANVTAQIICMGPQ